MLKQFLLAVVALALVSTPAFAKGAARHCVDKDKKEISVSGVGKQAKAACKAAGGKWVKAKTSKAH